LDASTPPNVRVLALVGMPGAGKSVCAAHLAARGFYKFRFGQIVVDEVARRGLPLNPQNERLVREEFRAREGMNAIAQRALPYLTQGLETHTSIIIDGLYGFGEYKLLRTGLEAPMRVLSIVADRDIRYGRLAARPERPLTAAEALERDIREIENLEKGGPIAIADYTLLNNDTEADLIARLDALVARIGLVP
jgi:dephospho-CoA kinase